MAAIPALNLKSYEASMAWLDDRQDKMVDQVKAWSKINSGSTNLAGLEAMAKPIVSAFSDLGGQYERIDLAPATQVTDRGEVCPLALAPVHRFVMRPGAKRRILLTGHLDTVFPADHPFQTYRYLDANTLNGPGVADMKGGLIVMLNALLAFEAHRGDADLGWEILISSDEEIGSTGSGAVLAERAPHAHIGLTYEPALADGTLAGARKGSGNFTFIVKGKAAHAGREFHLGRNAITAMADLVSGLNALNGQREGITINPAVIHGGTAPNIVPDTAILRFNSRVNTETDAQWVEAHINQLLEDISGRDGIDVDLHGGFNRPPKEITPANQALFDCVAACGDALHIPVSYRETGGCCEGNNLAAAGLPNVDTLGVRGGKIHSGDEYVLIDSFAERAKLSALIIHAFADGHFDTALSLGVS